MLLKRFMHLLKMPSAFVLVNGTFVIPKCSFMAVVFSEAWGPWFPAGYNTWCVIMKLRSLQDTQPFHYKQINNSQIWHCYFGFHICHVPGCLTPFIFPLVAKEDNFVLGVLEDGSELAWGPVPKNALKHGGLVGVIKNERGRDRWEAMPPLCFQYKAGMRKVFEIQVKTIQTDMACDNNSNV